MGTPVIVFPDAPSHVANQLRTWLQALSAPPAYTTDVSVGILIPTGREHPANPLIVISQDGPGSMRTRALTRVPLRLAVWHHTSDAAFDLAQFTFGAISSFSDQVVRSIQPDLSPTRAVDPDTGGAMAWGIVSAFVKPTQY